jgi:AcrR family transcriptional regulator
MPTVRKKAPAPALDTRSRLIKAASEEFCRSGFSGTDSNKIARRAGFAPQTFYRWFTDKTGIFLAVYREWEEEERRTLGALITQDADALQLVQAIVTHHRDYRVFRRSLRQLAVEDPMVRKERADSRIRQIEQIAIWARSSEVWNDEHALLLLQIERLADAAADDELTDMGVAPDAAYAAIAELIARLRS